MNPSTDGTKKYKAARSKNFNTFDLIKFHIKLIWILLITFIQCIPDLFESLKRFLTGTKPKSIKEQVALVTGGANGLGKEIAICLASNGCKVAVADIDFEAAEATANEISKKFKVPTKAFECDVSNYGKVLKLKTDIESSLGFVDILINNAGLISLVSLREGSNADIQKILDVNLASHFWTCRVFLNGMIQRKRGHIVAIASILSYLSVPRSIAYSTTKFGIRGFMNALYAELCAEDAEKFVHVTTVYPSFINTCRTIDTILDAVDSFVQPLEAPDVACKIVNAIRANCYELHIPSNMKFVMRIIDWVPLVIRKKFIFNSVKDLGWNFVNDNEKLD